MSNFYRFEIRAILRSISKVKGAMDRNEVEEICKNMKIEYPQCEIEIVENCQIDVTDKFL